MFSSEGKKVGRGEESDPFNFATMLASAPVGVDCAPRPNNSEGTFGFDMTWQPPLKPIGLWSQNRTYVVYYQYTLQEEESLEDGTYTFCTRDTCPKLTLDLTH